MEEQQRTPDTTQQVGSDSAYPVFSALTNLPKTEIEQEDKDKNAKTHAQQYRVTRARSPHPQII